MAARDGDYPGFRFFPDDPSWTGPSPPTGALTRANGANWDAGRRLLALGPRRPGSPRSSPSASTWCFATPEDRDWWGGLWADRFTASSLADQLLDHGIATPSDLASFADAWRRWAASPDGWFAVLHGEVLCTA